MTIRQLHAWAVSNRVADAHIRICDGMAVSYYPCLADVKRGRYEVIIDVSACDPIEFDELHDWSYPILQD